MEKIKNIITILEFRPMFLLKKKITVLILIN